METSNVNVRIIHFFLIFVGTLVLWSYLFIFYTPNQKLIMEWVLLNLPYSVAIFVDESRLCCMLHIQPQNVHLFIEYGRLVYQPTYQDDNKITCMDTHPDLGYEMSYKDNDQHPPKIICRRPLKFLHECVYTNMTYKRLFTTVQNPMGILYTLIREGWLKPFIPPQKEINII